MIEKASDKKNKNQWKIPREISFWRLAKCKNASANKETKFIDQNLLRCRESFGLASIEKGWR